MLPTVILPGYFESADLYLPLQQALTEMGTPQISCKKWIKKNLDFVNDNYPGAFYPEVRYVCVAGRSIYGKQRLGHCLTYSSYQMICGAGNTWGDGITPVTAAHLAGAMNITIEGVKHSPNTAGIWYGSPEARSRWVGYLS